LERVISVGSVCRSRAGRDKGQYFIVYGILDDQYVLLVDGKQRTLSKPKRKKKKHLYAGPDVILELADKITQGRCLGDDEVRKALRGYMEARKLNKES